ncbi:helix-turn-helix transcriptional regulator [Streptomyces sp. NPDC051940]|uniref:helix-turn-helix domain-containing protein n=1 Tax=Streptomyces sp. NPDC051940 TaxID=3155675 RepID=UPI0034485B61
MYVERAADGVPGAVVWIRTGGTGGPYRVLPDGCMDLIWSSGTLLVAGPDTRAHLGQDAPGAEHAALRFAPGQGAVLLGVPAVELRDTRVPLDALWPTAEARRLAERIGEAADRGAVLERVAGRLLARAEPPEPYLPAVVRGLRAGRSVAEVSAAAGVGERTLHRRSLAVFGYGPKTLARVLRMNRALELVREGRPFAEVAALAGYADQAHLSRDVKALAGVPLGRLSRADGQGDRAAASPGADGQGERAA